MLTFSRLQPGDAVLVLGFDLIRLHLHVICASGGMAGARILMK